jgi:hypothetical protein
VERPFCKTVETRVMRLLLDTLIRWLITAGMCLGAVAYFRGSNLDLGFLTLNAAVAGIIAAAVVLMTAVALEGTNRCLILLICWCDPPTLKRWIANLDSPGLREKRLALRTVADYLGARFGVVGPFDWCQAEEIEAHITIIKKLWAARQAVITECPSQEWLLPKLSRNMKDTFWRIAQCRVDWMLAQIPEYFQKNTSGPESPLSLPEQLPPLDSDRLIEAMQSQTTHALQRAAQIVNDAPAGSLIVDSEEAIGEFFAQLFLEAYRVMLLLRMGSSAVDPLELFSTDRGSFKKVLRDFAGMIEKFGEALKDGLIDLNLLEERPPPEQPGAELPCMASEEFVHAMRPQAEMALRQFVEITNQTPDGLILVAEEPSVCRIFATLHAQALETGLRLRLQRIPPSPLGGEASGARGTATPHLRKAASPALRPPFLGWAAKYRYMKVAGTRFPLLHQDPPDRSASTAGDDSTEPPITSVKPGPGAL